MIKCEKCATAIEASHRYCQKCGAMNTQYAQPTNGTAKRVHDAKRRCPQCDETMQSLDVGMHDSRLCIERCGRCLGVFFDMGELEPVLQFYAENISFVGHSGMREMYDYHANGSHNNNVVRCPMCQVNMTSQLSEERGGLTIFVCQDHGTWLSGHELRRLLNWATDAQRLTNIENTNSDKPKP